MRRPDLRHIARAIREITGAHEAVVVGSQGALGTFEEDLLPSAATMSREADVAFWNDSDNAIADRVDGAIGELSLFDSTHGYYAQGVSISTAKLPLGWEERLVRLHGQSEGETQIWCPEIHDLCVSKLCAHREKDYEYVAAFLHAGLVDLDLLKARAEMLPLPSGETRLIVRWLEGRRRLL